MEWNYDAGKFWVDAVMMIWVIAAAIITWRVTRSRGTKESIDAIDDKVGELEGEVRRDVSLLRADISKLETQVDNLPSHEDIGRLYERLSTVEGQLNQLIGGVNGLVRGFDTINSYLLNKEKK